jgi:hypothetical protein
MRRKIKRNLRIALNAICKLEKKITITEIWHLLDYYAEPIDLQSTTFNHLDTHPNI